MSCEDALGVGRTFTWNDAVCGADGEIAGEFPRVLMSRKSHFFRPPEATALEQESIRAPFCGCEEGTQRFYGEQLAYDHTENTQQAWLDTPGM